MAEKIINLAGLSTFKTCMEEEFNSALTITVDKIEAIPIVSGSGAKSAQQKETALASGDYSFAVGFSVSAVGIASYAEGAKTYASGNRAHAEGFSTSATGDNSHAENGTSVASGMYSHAGGDHSTASGIASFAHGATAVSSGNRATSFGLYTSAVGDNSFAIGNHTIAGNTDEVAIGQYNNIHSDTNTFGSSANTICSIGIGTSNANAKNALEIMQNGDIYVSGVGGYTGTTIGGDVKTLQNVINASGPKYVQVNNNLAFLNGLIIINSDFISGDTMTFLNALFKSIGATGEFSESPITHSNLCKFTLMNSKICYGDNVYFCFYTNSVGSSELSASYKQDINPDNPDDSFEILLDFQNDNFIISR